MRLAERPVPDFKRHKRDEGPHKGIAPPNIHAWIFYACNNENGVDANTYRMLRHELTLDDLLDLIEMKQVRESWTHAELLNADARKRKETERGLLG